jgi:hypothetical protein
MKRASENPNLQVSKRSKADRKTQAEIFKLQENFQPLPKPRLDLMTMFHTSLPIFDAVVKHLALNDLISFLAVLGFSKSVCWYCSKHFKGFAKEYVSYLSTLSPVEDVHFIEVINYCRENMIEIKLEDTLFYPRSEAYIRFLDQKDLLFTKEEDAIKLKDLKIKVREAAIIHQVLPQDIVEKMWKAGPRHISNLLKHQKIYEANIDRAVLNIRYIYPRHSLTQIREYGIKNPTLFQYSLLEMPATTEFIEFLKLALGYDAFCDNLFPYICVHLETVEHLSSLFFEKSLKKLLMEYGRNYQDTNLSMELLKRAWRLLKRKAPIYEYSLQEILAHREWEPKQLLEFWKLNKSEGYNSLMRIIYHIIEVCAKNDLKDWEIFIPHLELKYIKEKNLKIAFLKRYPQLWNNSSFWERNLNLICLDFVDEFEEYHKCWNIITQVIFTQKPIDWERISQHKSKWDHKVARRLLPRILYYKYIY